MDKVQKPSNSKYYTSSSEPFSIYLYSFELHYGPGVDSASNRNEYQESSGGGKGRAAGA
jgi:hypothetical protein